MKKARRATYRNALLAASGLALAAGAPAAAQPGHSDPQPPTNAAADAPPPQDDQGEITVTGHYLGSSAHSASKMDLSVIETPFSDSSYSRSFVKAVTAANVTDLYRYMNSVQRSGPTGYDINIRGITSTANDRNSILIDGLPGLSTRFGSPPTIGVDHIEVVKGPTAVLYGEGQPGGFLDIITRKPSSTPSFEFDLQDNIGIGTHHRASGGNGAFSATGPVDGAGHVLAIATVELVDRNSFRDFNFEKSVFFSPGLTLKLGDNTDVTLLGEYRYLKTKFEGGLVAPFRDESRIASINTSYQGPNDKLEEYGETGSIFVTHRFSRAVALHVNYRYVNHYDDGYGFDNQVVRADGITLGRRAREIRNYRKFNYVDSNLTAGFNTFGLRHRLIVGVTAGTDTTNSRRLQFFNAPATGPNSLDVNIYNPVFTNRDRLSYPAGTLQWRLTDQSSVGVYASDIINLTDSLKVMAGVRYAHERQKVTDLLAAPGTIPRDVATNKVLPLAGIVFQPRPNYSVYVSYSTSYNPVAATAQDINGQFTFRPTFASSIEAGAKANLFRNRLLVTTAIFDIKRKDVVSSFTCALGTCSRQVGADRATGFEFELSGSPLPNLEVLASYTYVNSRITASDVAAQVGARQTNAPKNAAKLWARYDVRTGALAGVGVGVGVSYVGDRVVLLPTGVLPTGVLAKNETFPLSAYTTADFALFYALTQNIELTAKITNLFDRRYMESGLTELSVTAGAPRTLQLAVRVKL